MIISPKYKFIFIKTQKTAGSSIEKVLLDKISDDENLVFGGMPPENMPPKNLKKEYEHVGIKFIKTHYPNEWKKYFKFTIERNSWDKVVSQYYWVMSRNNNRAQNGFENFVLNDKKINHMGGWNLYTENNVPVVDYIIQYNQLEKDFSFILKKLDLSYNNELKITNLKSGHRKEKDYRKFYTDKTRDYVNKLYKKPIEYFNYSF